MAYKIKAPYEVNNTPLYFVEEEQGVLGRANKNGTITINNKVRDNEELEEIRKHEEAHVDQFKDFEKSGGKKGLDYTEDSVTWEGNSYSRKNGKIKYKGKWHEEGWKGFPWEAIAYKKEKL